MSEFNSPQTAEAGSFITTLREWTLSEVTTVYGSVALDSDSEALALESWLKDVVQFRDIEPWDHIVDSMVQDGFDLKDARYLLAAAFLRYGGIPLSSFIGSPRTQPLLNWLK